MKRDYERFAREQLYELVWSQPMVKLSVRFRMSDVALKKICRKNNIPAPSRGYWRRVETGGRVTQAPLPRMKDARDIIINVKPEPEHLVRDTMSDDIRVQVEAAQQGARIVVPEVIEKPHRVTQATRRILKGARVDDYGATKCDSAEVFIYALRRNRRSAHYGSSMP